MLCSWTTNAPLPNRSFFRPKPRAGSGFYPEKENKRKMAMCVNPHVHMEGSLQQVLFLNARRHHFETHLCVIHEGTWPRGGIPSPYFDSSATRATYSAFAASLSIPSRAFHASHFAFPVMSSIPGRSVSTFPLVACLNSPYSFSWFSCDTFDSAFTAAAASSKVVMMVRVGVGGVRGVN
eukprot:TRINITY_DN32062_c0_g1_i1.p1 TRINITY_DN32062_c0_g1~~TRINITY_DN32062_c0_g1_i1.p1  ORF type:complete len:179 (-),score=0.61 TRINITY_DN32062_c0_g1_i1:21-557(-)